MAIRIVRGRGRCAVAHPSVHRFAQLSGFVRVGGAGMRWQSHGRFGELAFAPLFHGAKKSRLRENRCGENLDELLLEFTHLQFAGRLDQCRAQIELCLLSVEAAQAFAPARAE